MFKGKRKNKLEYSKVILCLVGLLFVCTIIFCLTRDYSSYFDTAVYVSAISATGTIFCTGLVWYLKKSTSEHVSTAGQYMYQSIMKIRLEYIEGRLKLEKKYKISEEDINNIENESPLDEMTDTQLSNMQTKLDSQMDDATSPTEIQNVS